MKVVKKEAVIMEKQYLYGLTHLYDTETDTTQISWSYQDDPELEYFVLETYDEIKKEWIPYDGRMGIIEKDITY